MLHEILLSLSGHPSALFETIKDSGHVTSSSIPLLSPPEVELLSSLGRLSRLHRQTRDHTARIAASHPSTICRAVATAISSHHLDTFQQKVLEVESKVLKQDADTVGAYKIVPLAAIVSEFSEWTRVMEWLWSICTFIFPLETSRAGKEAKGPASGAELIDKLRVEAQTGYPDIETAALHLGAVAETSWLRQLATWLLYGRLPSFGASDFFISADNGDEPTFLANHKMLPKFATRLTASSILFVGRSLNQIRALPSSSKMLFGSTSKVSELELLPAHVAHLSEVKAPISSARLSDAVRKIRQSLSRNLLQYLLPREKIVETLTVLHQFFLLGRGEFAMALIAEADDKIQSRHRAPVSQSSKGVRGILLKEAEINNTLHRAWAVLSSLGGEDDHTDDILDVAIDIVHIRNTTSSVAGQRPGTPGRARDSSLLPKLSDVVFHDLLLSVPTKLTMDIRSPLDLFMAKSDLDMYSSINAYLLAVRRAHLHLAQLWRQSFLRREQSTTPSQNPRDKAAAVKRRARTAHRNREMRKVWATCTAAIFFLSESEAYFQGEVVQESFKHFLQWVVGPDNSTSAEEHDSPSPPSTDTTQNTSTLKPKRKRQHDPEALSSAHRSFLTSVCTSLLLTDQSFPTTLRSFFTHVDELVALITRLQSIRQNLDMEEDTGAHDYLANYKQEEKDVNLQLDRARRRLDSDMKSLIGRLRDIDSERVGSVLGLGVNGNGQGASGAAAGAGGIWDEEEGYEPLRVGGVDILLMKLDWSTVDDDEDEFRDLL